MNRRSQDTKRKEGKIEDKDEREKPLL